MEQKIIEKTNEYLSLLDDYRALLLSLSMQAGLTDFEQRWIELNLKATREVIEKLTSYKGKLSIGGGVSGILTRFREGAEQ